MSARRRTFGRAAVCLALGLVTTVAVAWLAVAIPIEGPSVTKQVGLRSRNPARAEGQGDVQVFRFERAGLVFFRSGTTPAMPKIVQVKTTPEEIVPHWAVSAVLPWGQSQTPWPADQAFDLRALDGRGWPMVALASAYVWVPDSAAPSGKRPVACDGIPTGDRKVRKGQGGWQYPVVLPCRPIPLGLIADTLFYASLWATLLFAPGFVRRRVRRRRNHCPRCNYSLAGIASSACPECGNPYQYAR